MKRSSLSGYLLLDHQLASPSPFQYKLKLNALIGKDVGIVIGSKTFHGTIKHDIDDWFKFIPTNKKDTFNFRTIENGSFSPTDIYSLNGNTIELFEWEG